MGELSWAVGEQAELTVSKWVESTVAERVEQGILKVPYMVGEQGVGELRETGDKMLEQTMGGWVELRVGE